MKTSFSLSRLLPLAAVFLAYYGLLLHRFWQEQVQQGAKHRDVVSKQSIRRIRQPSIRGRIFSADGRILADTTPSFDLVFHPAEMRQPGPRQETIDYILACANQVGRIIGRPSPLTKAVVTRHLTVRPALPLPVFENLNERELATAVEMSPPVAGMEVVSQPVRCYPEGRLACHLVGYVGRADPGTAADRDDYSYYIPDMKGQSGVEQAYDDTIQVGGRELRGMRGMPGESLVLVDFRGYIHQTLDAPSQVQAGHDVVLTIDARAQAIAEGLLLGQRGTFVLLDAEDGAVIAMASSPGYDLREFTPRLPTTVWQRLSRDPSQPLLHRPTMGQYTPGSIAKPLVAMAILSAGIDPEETVNCDGRARIGNTSIRCWSWRSGGHGPTSLVSALEQSCNVYFIEQAQRIGMEAVTATMHDFGIGEKTGFALPEREGLLPTRERQRAIHRTAWTAFDTGLLAIGQGIILVTPLQAALYAAAIANGGNLYQPYLLREVRDRDGNTLAIAPPHVRNRIKLDPAHLRLVREGMYRVIHGENGSALRAATPTIALCGKTGTAEVGPRDARKTNTWFIGFGYHHGRTYAFSVFIEEGLSGGRTSAPIARDFFDLWLPPPTPEEAPAEDAAMTP
jgi:penicillin-binding protein 2